MKAKSLGKSDWPSQCQSARHRLRVLEQLQGRGLAEQYIYTDTVQAEQEQKSKARHKRRQEMERGEKHFLQV